MKFLNVSFSLMVLATLTACQMPHSTDATMSVESNTQELKTATIAKQESDPGIESINAFFASDTMPEVMPESEMIDEALKMGTLDQMTEDNAVTFSATYTDYEAGAGAGQKHVLFFHAPWCPTCVKWEGKVKENMDNLNANVVIYKADYDSAEDLKAQYEITKQSTVVYINADGTVAKMEMDPSLENLKAFFAN